MGFAYGAGGVDLVAQDDHGSRAVQLRARRRKDGRVQVRGPVGTGHGGVAHGAGDHDGLVAVVDQVQEVGALLDGVGALGDDHAIASAVHSFSGSCGQGGQVLEGQ